tara:strand:+ start:526 stop:1053 length:528 start_codon:yes stop_codon:yes gene_type:complete
MSNVKNVLDLVTAAEGYTSELRKSLDDAANLLQEMDMGASSEDVVESARLWDQLVEEVGEGGEDLFELAENSIRMWGAVEDLGYSDSGEIETLMDEHTDYEAWRSEVMGALDEYQDDPRLAGLASNTEADGAVHQINMLADGTGSNKVLDAIKSLISALEEEQVIGSGNARKEEA